MKNNQFYLIGCASGIAGANVHSGDGPLKIKESKHLAAHAKDMQYEWRDMITASQTPRMRREEEVGAVCELLAQEVSRMVKSSLPFCVIGGDHSCAIGTWSGVYDALHEQGDFGLIWIDAHMDSHTPETSPSGNIHGMPVACLLGYGYPALTHVLHQGPKIKPENICLIGVRSFEDGEAELLRRLKVRVYYMQEVLERGLAAIMQEALEYVNQNTIGFGLTIDVDSVDPADAPGVDVPEQNGIRATDLLQVVLNVANDPRLIAAEVVEFDPGHDVQEKTEILMANLIHQIAKGIMKA